MRMRSATSSAMRVLLIGSMTRVALSGDEEKRLTLWRMDDNLTVSTGSITGPV
jgi:hypothetical protein